MCVPVVDADGCGGLSVCEPLPQLSGIETAYAAHEQGVVEEFHSRDVGRGAASAAAPALGPQNERLAPALRVAQHDRGTVGEPEGCRAVLSVPRLSEDRAGDGCGGQLSRPGFTIYIRCKPRLARLPYRLEQGLA